MPKTWGLCVSIQEAFKAPTCLLLDKDYKFIAFGFEAQAYLAQAKIQDKLKYHFFEKFKMHLHNKVIYIFFIFNLKSNCFATTTAGWDAVHPEVNWY